MLYIELSLHGVLKCISQRPFVCCDMRPANIIVPFFVACTESLSKWASHPSSASWPIEIKEPDTKEVKPCAVLDYLERWGNPKLPMYVDSMVTPSHSSTYIPGITGLTSVLSTRAVVASTKWPVDLVSSMVLYRETRLFVCMVCNLVLLTLLSCLLTSYSRGIPFSQS